MTAPGAGPLQRKRAAARLVLWFEQAWPAVWPALGVLGAYACAALLDIPDALPPWPRIAVLGAVLLIALGLLVRGVSRVRLPSPAQGDRRLEQASGLRHRPLAALADSPVSSTDEVLALWRVHRERLARQVRRLRVGGPRPGLPALDRRALRGAIVLGLGAAFVIAGPNAGARLWRGFVPRFPAAASAPGTAVQAWITPPAYTALPPQFLQTDTPVISAPAGSLLTVSVTGGGPGAPELALDGVAEPFKRLDAASWQADRTLDAGGALVVRRAGTIASWSLSLIPDHAPTAAFTDPPGPASAGGRPTQQTRLAWQASDDYGVTALQAELRLRDRPAAPPVGLPIPIPGAIAGAQPGTAKHVQGTQLQDLTAHPWAGLPVVARLVARDALGQTGTSADATFVLPERPFNNPLARAVIAVRRQLSLTPDARWAARATLDDLLNAPENTETSASVVLNLRAIGALLVRGHGDQAVAEAQARMWELALSLEEGAAERTARALAEARQATRDAVDGSHDTPADRAEIDRRVQELRDAIQRHLEALAEQARRDGTELPYDSTAPKMNSRDLDRLAEQMRDAAREGRMDDAKQQMAELERLLEQLQNARPERGDAQEQKNAERRERGRQQMDAVQDIVRREGGLLDRSQSRSAEGRRTPPVADTREPDGRSQRALRRALGELMQRFGDLAGEVPAPLGEADTAMRDAAQALGEGRDATAGAAQTRAIEALQKGGKEMGQQMAKQFGPGKEPGEGDEGEGDGTEPGTTGEGGQDPKNRNGQSTGPLPGDSPGSARHRTARRDPLGRPMQQGTSGAEDSGDVHVPDQMEQARTRAIQDELRRRGADRTRPQPELDYIERLLKPF